MPAETSRVPQQQWRDAEGNHITLLSWVEQVAEHPEHGALFSRLHQRGEVVGRGTGVLYVRFEGKGQVVSVLPELVRLLASEPREHRESPSCSS